MKKSCPTIDVVIPAHKKDLQILEYCIDSAKKKIVGAGRIIVISKERYSDNAEWFDEALFPFTIEMVRDQVGNTSCGWYFQQLLKFYAPIIIPNISENVLILDSDTVFFRRVKMIDDKGHAFYNILKETNISRKGDFDDLVAQHMEQLFPAIAQKNLPPEFQNISGITHNMVFNREVLRDLFKKVEEHHNNGEPFYKIFLKFSRHTHCASEYQIYFNFLLLYHKEKIRIRKLRFKNTSDINIRKYRNRLKYHYCSFHSYLRNCAPNSSKIKFERSLVNFIKKLFYLEISNIGVADCNIGKFVNLPNQKIEWLPHLKLSESYLNPFGFIDKNGKKTVFCEKRSLGEKTPSICQFELGKNLEMLNKKTVLENFSLAQIFCDNDQKFALVKDSKNKFEIRQISDDGAFNKIANLFNNLEIINPAIKKYNGKWWLFFTQNSDDKNKLYVAFGDDLNSWNMHPQNPIALREDSAHIAGEIFYHHNNLYRPAWNLTRSCNPSIMLNQILNLDETQYCEGGSEIGIFANQLGEYPDGLCGISKLGEELTLISGKKFRLALSKPLILASIATLKLFKI